MSNALLHAIAEGFGSAIDDIRQKVVEEGWFGRSVTSETTTQETNTTTIEYEPSPNEYWPNSAINDHAEPDLSPDIECQEPNISPDR